MSFATGPVVGSSGGSSGGGDSVATGANTQAVYRTDLSTGDQTLTFGGTSFGVEIINDSVNNVAVNFSGAAAVIPTSSATAVLNHLIRPKEARYFPVSCTAMHYIADTAATTVRITFFLVTP